MYTRISPTFIFLFVVFISYVTSHHHYAVVIDAGSSGTRVWVYKWKNVPNSLPKYEFVGKKKTNPGISDFVDNKQGLVHQITEMIDKAKELVPQDQTHSTSVYLLATAGMRSLIEGKTMDILELINATLSDPSINPFHYRSSNLRVLSGEEEGAFAWVAVNYMYGVFNDTSKEPDYKRTYGILEKGGASTQITFVSKWPILANLFPVTIAGHRYSLYSHSYLGLGQESTYKWLIKELIENGKKDPESGVIENPCFNEGHELHKDNIKLQGKYNEQECEDLLSKLVMKSPPRFCHPKPCGIGSIYQPSISDEQKFYALSVYPKIFSELYSLPKNDDEAVDLHRLTNITKFTCAKSFEELTKDVDNKKYVELSCYMGHFVRHMLINGYGFKEESKNIFVINKKDSNNADWTLGALIYENHHHHHHHHHHRHPSASPSTGSSSSLSYSSSLIFFAITFFLYKLFPFPVFFTML